MSRTSTASSSLRSAAPATALPEVPSTARAVESALDELGVTPRKRLGQSFLVDPFIADAEAALVGAGGPVLEIGGGLGLLTQALVRRGFEPITVIERDHALAEHLRRTFGDRIVVEEADARVAPWPADAPLVGNLPFSAGTDLVIRALKERGRSFVVLLQKEVAERLAAAPGSKAFGRLSILAALYGAVELYQVVPPAAFEPVPAVAGRLVRFVPRPGPLPIPSVERFERLVAAIFSQRRKQLGNLLPRAIPGGRSAEALARAAAWPSGWSTLRPEALPPEAYFRLATEIESGTAL